MLDQFRFTSLSIPISFRKRSQHHMAFLMEEECIPLFLNLGSGATDRLTKIAHDFVLYVRRQVRSHLV